MPRLHWVGSVVSEGGPLLVANARDYASWTGARNPKGEKPRTLHFWGQFTARLPKKFQPNGKVGHQYLQAKSADEAVALVHELRAAVQKLGVADERWKEKPKSGEIVAGWSLKNFQSMQLELVNPSAYDLAGNVSDSEDGAGFLPLGDGRTALIWDCEGSGAIQLGVSPKRDELVLLRWWVDEDEHEALCFAHVDAPVKGEKKLGALELDDAQQVVAWAAPPRDQLSGVKTDAALRAVSKKKEPLFGGDVGAVFSLLKGRYAVTAGRREEDDEDYSLRWCRLQRV